MKRAERLIWYKSEFDSINKKIKNSDCLSHYDLLRIRNYKLQNISTESEKNITKKTKEAFKLAEEDNIKGAVQELTALNGVGIPVASAILAMRYPKKFAIIDRRVIKALGKKEWLKDYDKKPGIYACYLHLIRQKAKEDGTSLRDYERKLFEKA